MANVSHLTLTGAEVHEPKGIENASLGEVYVANGNGSGNWSSVGTSSFTGMIADFTWPVVQEGWLECDGSDINTTTYGALYSVMTIQQTGTRISGNPTITSLSSTANMRVGYYVFGTGIAAGTTILSINSSNQITLSGNASSSGTATVVVSPWMLNNGTIRLPDLSSAGRFRRSRTSGTAVGQLQASQNLAHTHTGTSTGSTNAAGASTPTFSGFTDPVTVTSTTSLVTQSFVLGAAATNQTNIPSFQGPITSTGSFTPRGVVSTLPNHTHTVTTAFTTDSTGDSESRPSNIVVMTCVKI